MVVMSDSLEITYSICYFIDTLTFYVGIETAHGRIMMDSESCNIIKQFYTGHVRFILCYMLL
jgi:hypothetical protein